MIVGVGIDAVEIARIDQLIARFGERAAQRVFTARELEIAGDSARRHETLAARFAAKEAAMKALGTGWAQGVAFVDFEIEREPSGAPRLTLRGAALAHATRLGVTRVHLSLTHTATTATAVVVLESGGAATSA